MPSVQSGTKAAGYIRLSLFDDAATSPARQRADLQRLADALGWDLDIYEDIDRSAYSGVERPAYDRMMAALSDYDVLACWKVDRMLRRARDLPAIQDACERHGVQLHSATEGALGGGPGGNFILGVFAGLAELESATISMRVKSSQQHLVQVGRWRGGIRPFGYRSAPHPEGGRRLEPDPDEAAVAVEIVRRTILGESARSIAWDLNQRGIATTRGKPWSSRTLTRMLRSPTLLGQHTSGGDVHRGGDGLPVQMWEPLIDPFTWQRLQAEMTARNRGARRRQDSTLLGGIVKCVHCGGSMGGWSADSPQAAYTCHTRHQYGPERCPGNAINRMKLDELVVGLALEVVTAERISAEVAKLHERATRPDAEATRIAQLEQALSTLEHDRQVLRLYDDDEARYVARWREYTEELSGLKQQTQQPAGPSLGDVAGNGDLADRWPAMDRHQRRRAILSAVRCIIVHPMTGKKRWEPERAEIRWAWEPETVI